MVRAGVCIGVDEWGRRGTSTSADHRSAERGDHGGFLGGEYGQTGEPDAFAATLREVLTA
jgi:hypothetical protein